MSCFNIRAFPGIATLVQGLSRACVLFMLLAVVAASPLQAKQTATLNLKDANIMVLIEMVSEITGKNFIVDPRVRGKVTVVSNQPLNADEVYQVFVSILEVHGFSTVPNGDVIKIVPENKARFDSIPSQTQRRSSVPSDQMVTRVIKVNNVSATQLVPILRPLIPQQGHLAAHAETNTLVISDKASNVNRLADIVAGMDRNIESDIELIPLHHANAAEVVRIINGLNKPAGKDGAASLSGPAQLAADERTNAIMVSGAKADRDRIRRLVSQLDTPVPAARGNTNVVYLKYAKAKDLVPVLTGIAEDHQAAKSDKDAPAQAAISKVSIRADESSNSLVITAAPKIFDELQDVIRKLDIRRAQVMVEAIIAEVALDKSRALGVEWIVDGASSGGNAPIGVVNFANATGIASAAATIAGGGVPSIGDGGTLGFGMLDSNSLNFAVLARALAGDATTNILSTPSLMTLDNQSAEIVIGQNVPFVTGEYASSGNSSNSVNPFRTIQREDVGLTLRVTPQINEGGAIQLEIEQEVSSISASAVGASDLITNKRVIKTTVMIDDGSTVVLGGLMDENLQQSEQKVPLLGDIPVVGGLFRSSSTTKTKRDLMVFLRPTILRDGAVQARVTGNKYNLMRAQQRETRVAEPANNFMNQVPTLPQRYPELPHPFEDSSPSSPW